jgi:transposase
LLLIIFIVILTKILWNVSLILSCRKTSREELFDALQGEPTAGHCFVLDELRQHIEELEARIARFDARLLEGLADERNVLALLQTLPGVDLIGAAMRISYRMRSGYVAHGSEKA